MKTNCTKFLFWFFYKFIILFRFNLLWFKVLNYKICTLQTINSYQINDVNSIVIFGIVRLKAIFRVVLITRFQSLNNFILFKYLLLHGIVTNALHLRVS